MGSLDICLWKLQVRINFYDVIYQHMYEKCMFPIIIIISEEGIYSAHASTSSAPVHKVTARPDNVQKSSNRTFGRIKGAFGLTVILAMGLFLFLTSNTHEGDGDSSNLIKVAGPLYLWCMQFILSHVYCNITCWIDCSHNPVPSAFFWHVFLSHYIRSNLCNY